jgi:diguanylate cyclase (GGDEF)-like protein/PAS domain S-box-containing protein
VGALAAFVIDFSALLLVGPQDGTLVAMARTLVLELWDRDRHLSRRHLPFRLAITILTMQAAGAAHLALGGTYWHYQWPSQALPIAAAAIVYWTIEFAATELLIPLATRHRIHWLRVKRLLRTAPAYVVALSIAVAFVEAVEYQLWERLLAASVPLALVYHAHRAHVRRLELEYRRQDLAGALTSGMALIDSAGCVTHWDEVLERLLSCPRAQVIGRTLTVAMPDLERTELPRAINEALLTAAPRAVPRLVRGGEDTRVFHVTIQPSDSGATVLWQDVTEHARVETALTRQQERLTLAAEGAYDGLWALDLRQNELYVSARWKRMLGIAGSSGTGSPAEWLNRVHPDDLEPLKQALRDHLSGKTEYLEHEHRLRHEDGTYRRVLCRGVAMRGPNRRAIRIAGSLTDTTDRSIAQERLRTAGYLDPLTGLCNRMLFVERLGRRLDEFKKGRSTGRFAVLYLDLDRFKLVNDSLGHLVGDDLLIAVSRRLESCVRPGDLVARLGGDEFAILLNGLNDEQQASVVGFRIRDALSAPFSIGGREVFTSASIGIAFGLAHYTNPDEIMRDADTAMYHAKSRGKARHELFDADMHARTRDRLDLETDLRHAVQDQQFEVHYQPIVTLSSGMCIGFESLVRWTRNGEPISPATFIPIAEELGLIEALGTWVMEQACSTFADWQRRFPRTGLDCITVNVSSRQLMQQNFPRIVEQAIHKAGLKACDLRLEITETALMDNPQTAAEVLRDLRDLGVKIYLDDFGTGYSSLSHLHKLPVDALKIDRSFVRSLTYSDRPAIVESILALARTLNTSVVAEGIETDQQSRELERLGCTHAQGYLFSKPLSAHHAEQLIVANQPLGPKQARRKTDEITYPSAFEWPAHLLHQRTH